MRGNPRTFRTYSGRPGCVACVETCALIRVDSGAFGTSRHRAAGVWVMRRKRYAACAETRFRLGVHFVSKPGAFGAKPFPEPSHSSGPGCCARCCAGCCETCETRARAAVSGVTWAVTFAGPLRASDDAGRPCIRPALAGRGTSSTGTRNEKPGAGPGRVSVGRADGQTSSFVRLSRGQFLPLCFLPLSAILARPSGVVGPVLSPPCSLQRPLL